jgi:hypothetical protein
MFPLESKDLPNSVLMDAALARDSRKYIHLRKKLMVDIQLIALPASNVCLNLLTNTTTKRNTKHFSYIAYASSKERWGISE